eukprot:249836-Chlamydomonas_euryale.AAC.1
MSPMRRPLPPCTPFAAHAAHVAHAPLACCPFRPCAGGDTAVLGHCAGVDRAAAQEPVSCDPGRAQAHGGEGQRVAQGVGCPARGRCALLVRETSGAEEHGDRRESLCCTVWAGMCGDVSVMVGYRG